MCIKLTFDKYGSLLISLQFVYRHCGWGCLYRMGFPTSLLTAFAASLMFIRYYEMENALCSEKPLMFKEALQIPSYLSAFGIWYVFWEYH